MEPGTPYLSLVVTARNDNHGGNLLGRMQAFLNGWIGQSKRHNLASELIIVDWNPPADRPALRDALQCPEDTGPCQVRFIQVSPELHSKFRHAESLPLYQMIAKNVGIRRSRGRFVLATNIDILFSDELVRYLAAGRLEKGRMYRLDRHDVMADVPMDPAVDQMLAYCRTHLIRINTREGTFNLSPDGLRELSAKDIAESGSGIGFGSGWFSSERLDGEVIRWVDNDAEVTVTLPPDRSRPFEFDVVPGPGVGHQPFTLQITDSGGAVLAGTRIAGRSRVSLHFPMSDQTRLSFRLHVAGGGEPAPRDPRTLNFRISRCVWGHPQGSANKRGEYVLHAMPLGGIFDSLKRLARRIADHRSDGPLEISVPPAVVRHARTWLGRRGDAPPVLRGAPAQVVDTPVFLHTNGCGDFTLMAREHWFDLRGYPEFNLFSFDIDSLFCYAAHHAGAREELLPDPMRIYHIEHGLGSGWSPEGQAKLFERLRDKGIPRLDFQTVMAWCAEMRRLDSPFIFNRDNWGLADVDLPEMPAPIVRFETAHHP